MIAALVLLRGSGTEAIQNQNSTASDSSIGRPVSVTVRTAFSRNSASNFHRFSAMTPDFPYSYGSTLREEGQSPRTNPRFSLQLTFPEMQLCRWPLRVRAWAAHRGSRVSAAQSPGRGPAPPR